MARKTKDQNGSSISTNDEQHSPHPQKPEPQPQPQPPQESDDDSDETQNSPELKTPSSKFDKVKKNKKSHIKWSEKDEIALLRAMIDYKAKMGDDWNSKDDAFYEFVKDFLSVNITKNQLSDKVERLKKKYYKNKLFLILHKIWAGDIARKRIKRLRSIQKWRRLRSIRKWSSIATKKRNSWLFQMEKIRLALMEIEKLKLV